MEIVDAVWEKRNLGVRAYEIVLSNEDTLEALDTATVHVKQGSYVAIKTPIGSQEFLWGLAQRGYTFIETQIYLVLKKADFKPLRLPRAIQNNVTFEHFDLAEYEQIRARVEEQLSRSVFDTDRIALDPIFTLADANRRYQFWILDSLERGAQFVEMRTNGDPAGFYIHVPLVDPHASGGLAGMYVKYKHSGLGAVLLNDAVRRQIDSGCASIHTGVSSNNIGVLTVHEAIGYKVEKLLYVYVKHVL